MNEKHIYPTYPTYSQVIYKRYGALHSLPIDFELEAHVT